MTVRLNLRDGRIADICALDIPPSVEVRYVDGWSHVEAFPPHLLTEYGIAPVTLIRVEDDSDAGSRFGCSAGSTRHPRAPRACHLTSGCSTR